MSKNNFKILLAFKLIKNSNIENCNYLNSLFFNIYLSEQTDKLIIIDYNNFIVNFIVQYGIKGINS